MSIWVTIFVSGTTGAVISSILNYFFSIRLETRREKKRIQEIIVQNDKEIIEKLYGPIYTILGERVIPGDGYEGIEMDQLLEIRSLIDKYPHLVDTTLDDITYSYLESWNKLASSKDDLVITRRVSDTDRKLLSHVQYEYNFKKKKLNLPYDEKILKE